MVSFSCDACQDTIKKPKLQQHYYRCRSSVTCLDCSRCFGGPAEFAQHDSCISEAEAYQGKLYRGEKKGKKGPAQSQAQAKEQTQAKQQANDAQSNGKRQAVDAEQQNEERPAKKGKVEKPAASTSNEDDVATPTSKKDKKDKKAKSGDAADVASLLRDTLRETKSEGGTSLHKVLKRLRKSPDAAVTKAEERLLKQIVVKLDGEAVQLSLS